MRRSSLIVGLLIALFGILTGCRLGSNDPIGPQSSTQLTGSENQALTKTVRFQIEKPNQTSQAQERLSIRPSATTTASPSVTVTLTLINEGVATQTTTEYVKTVLVASDGVATLSFEGLPAKTVLGELDISGGNIDGATGFHGATDLLPGVDNVISVASRSSKLLSDVVAVTLKKVIKDYFSKIFDRTAARISLASADLATTSSTLYEDALNEFLKLTESKLGIKTETDLPGTTVSIGASGGKASINDSASPLNGFEINVPAGAFSGTTNVKVRYANIISHTLGTDIKPISPLISVDTEGKPASGGLSIFVPIASPTSGFPIVMFYDASTGELEVLPITSVSANGVTVFTEDPSGVNFAASHVRQSVKGSIRTSWLPVSTGIFAADFALGLVPNDLDTEFRPGVHTWKNVNYGSIVAPGGHCAGQTISSMWCFNRKIKPNVYGKWDRNQTNTISRDDADAIRLASMVQIKDIDWAGREKAVYGWAEAVSDETTFKLFQAAIYLTKKPQYIAARKAGGGGHALVVYRIEGNRMYLADPNYPTETRYIELVNGSFTSLSTRLNAEDDDNSFNQFRYFGMTALIKESALEQRWNEFKAGTVGQDFFPKYTFHVFDLATYVEDLTKEYCTSSPSIWLGLKKVGNSSFLNVWGLYIHSKTQQENESPKLPDRFITYPEEFRTVCEINLQPGANVLGMEIRISPSGTESRRTDTGVLKYQNPGSTAWKHSPWADFQWFTIYCRQLASLTINPQETTLLINKTYELKNVNITANYTDGTNEALSKGYQWVIGSGEGTLNNNVFTAPSNAGVTTLICSYTESGINRTATLTVNILDKVKVTKILSRGSLAMALKNDGTIWMWGFNSNGELGNGTTVWGLKPTQVLNITTAKDIALGTSHAFAILQDGSVWGWGSNSGGKLGIGDESIANSKIPVKMKISSSAKLVAPGEIFTVVVDTSGEAYVMGANYGVGALGLGYPAEPPGYVGGTYQKQNYCQPVPEKNGYLTGATHVACGYAMGVALIGGKVYSWGENSLAREATPYFIPGSTGSFSDADRPKPTIYTGINVVCGSSFWMTWGGDSVYAAGVNVLGSFGDGKDVSPSSAEAFQTLTGLSGIKQIALGVDQGIALLNDGRVFGWGNFKARTPTYQRSPVEETGFGTSGNVIMVSAGNHYRMALKDDGTVWTWGFNDYGVLGNGYGSGSVASPTQIQF